MSAGGPILPEPISPDALARWRWFGPPVFPIRRQKCSLVTFVAAAAGSQRTRQARAPKLLEACQLEHADGQRNPCRPRQHVQRHSDRNVVDNPRHSLAAHESSPFPFANRLQVTARDRFDQNSLTIAFAFRIASSSSSAAFYEYRRRKFQIVYVEFKKCDEWSD